jgi:tRNA dimethylallyltransferase
MISTNETGILKPSAGGDIPVLVIFAPTACGKTSLAEKLFALDAFSPLAGKAEIISADSMQVYKGMDIGTAKPDSEFLKKLPHHLINLCTPDVQFGVGQFVPLADKICADIVSRGKLPVVLGGTAFYIRNFVYGLPPTPTASEEIRDIVQKRMETEGPEKLWDELNTLDPESAEKIHINDEYRIKRALEVCLATGKPRSSFAVSSTPRKGFSFLVLALERDRSVLYDRINLRVDQMFEQGLEEEFNNLVKKGYTKEYPGMQAIGYREFFTENTIEAIKELIKKDSRKYAKRQETFFRPITDCCRYQAEAYEEILEKILRFYSYFT